MFRTFLKVIAARKCLWWASCCSCEQHAAAAAAALGDKCDRERDSADRPPLACTTDWMAGSAAHCGSALTRSLVLFHAKRAASPSCPRASS